MSSTKYTFREKQRFTQKWIWISLFLLWGVGLLIPFYAGSTGNAKLMDGAVLSSSILMILAVFLYIIYLEVEMDRDKIFWRFFPLTKKTIYWMDVEKAEVIDYGFIGGWGVRLFTKYGTAYNIRGKMGLHLTLKSGKSFLIGTQEPEKLETFLKSRNKRA